jgi:hypothetical protein
MTDIGYSGTPGLMIASLVLFGALVGMSNAAALDVRPVTGADFSPLLLGCWEEGWHAQFVDGTEGSGSSSICFRGEGSLLFTYESFTAKENVNTRGDGTYEINDNQIRLINGDPSVAWPFQESEIRCDGIIEPGKKLQLENCAGTPATLIEYHFSAAETASAIDLPGCWNMRDPEWERVRRADDSNYQSLITLCFEHGHPGQVIESTSEFSSQPNAAGNLASMGGEVFDRSGTYEVSGDRLHMAISADQQSCLFSIEAGVLAITNCLVENLNSSPEIEDTYYDRVPD